MTSTPREGYFGAAHARDVNIFIWTSRKSVDHETNDRVMVHGDGTRADGRRFRLRAHLSQIVGLRVRQGASWKRDRSFNVVVIQAGYLARPRTKAPETQIYFITHGSGPFPGLRLRTVVRGERASRSIVNRTTAFWSIWIVASLILAGLENLPVCM
jgi:hypothetical protein